MLEIEAIDHVAFSVNDIDQAAAWYTHLFDMERRYGDVWTGQRDPVVLCNGSACVALFRRQDTESLAPDPDHINRHFALKVNRQNFEQVQSRLRAAGIDFKLWDHKVSRSLYLLDPDAHQIEITTYDL
jgi:catechol 2,3-dioxygenase-like lactoylglutathione lyase family enzyme